VAEGKMKAHLTERSIKAAELHPARNIIVRDDEVIGFGVRVTTAGAKSFVLSYTIAGRERRITIGSWPDWSVSSAREKACELKRRIDNGDDPLAEREEARTAATIRELVHRYITEHVPTLAERHGNDQISMLRKIVEPEWGARKAADITETDVAKLLAKVALGRVRPHKAKTRHKRKNPLNKSRPHLFARIAWAKCSARCSISQSNRGKSV
jgi:Arm DNA-binding domain